MPIRVRWTTKDYFPFALMLLGTCGIFQLLFIFIAQYLLNVGNFYVVILIPTGVTITLFFGSMIIFESYAQVERNRKLKSRFQKAQSYSSTLERFLYFPVVRPLLIMFAVFGGLFFATYFFCATFLDKVISFLVSETFAAVISLLIANLIEKRYGRVKRY
ncbi:MAG: hypothetical protein EU531_00640 [Promethearchaeota archaeon]|nr:MAG: hypothetical protein EU531_00640 [Candidatus Lokiarchaeota archaeon]